MQSHPGGGIPPPPPPFFLPLPPGWTEHRAPAGQPYWFNPQTNVSTYVRPLPLLPPPGFPPPPPRSLPPLHFNPNPSGSSFAPPPTVVVKKEKKEKPKTKTPIEGTDWIKVETNKGNVFWTNSVTKESVWTLPGEIKEAIAIKARESGNEKKRKEMDDEEVLNDEGTAVEGETTTEGQEESTLELEVEVEGAAGSEALLAISDVIPTPEESDLPKKKKQKKKTVRDIEELEQDEDWQREVAAQMAAEVAETEAVEIRRIEEEMKPVPMEQVIQVVTPKIAISQEEGIALFKAMLSEKDISPMAPWDNELPKFINDPRYSSVKQLKDRRDLFDEYCKDKLREVRAAKKAAQEAGGPKADPLTGYRSLLLTAVTSTRTHFSDFKRTHSKDPRFREFGKTEGDKEKAFKGWLRELGERKRVEAKKAEERFGEMLREDKEIVEGNVWSTVKIRHVSDPRYEAVNSSSLRESLFTSYLASLSFAGTNKSDKAARAAASLKEREEQVRGEKERAARSTNAARGAMGREEGEREFATLLTDIVRDHEARWESVLSGLEPDPRFSSSNLSIHDKRRMFDSHLKSLYHKRLGAVENLFLLNSPSLTTKFTSVLPLIIESPLVTRLIGEDYDRLESLYQAWSVRRIADSRREFEQLMKESPILEHWGRLQKKVDAEGGGKEVLEEDEDDEDGALDLKTMAKQVDLKAIHAVLKHDARYQVFDHVPEERNGWVEQFLSNLAAPSATVHQK